MHHRVGSIRFAAPLGFEVLESKCAMGAAPDMGLVDPMLSLLGGRLSLSKEESGVRPNLVIRRRSVHPERGLGYVAQELVAKALHNFGVGVEELSQETFVYDDGTEGILVSFVFPTKRLLLQQYHAFRIDGKRLTHQALTVDAGQRSERVDRAHRECLAALALA